MKDIKKAEKSAIADLMKLAQLHVDNIVAGDDAAQAWNGLCKLVASVEECATAMADAVESSDAIGTEVSAVKAELASHVEAAAALGAKEREAEQAWAITVRAMLEAVQRSTKPDRGGGYESYDDVMAEYIKKKLLVRSYNLQLAEADTVFQHHQLQREACAAEAQRVLEQADATLEAGHRSGCFCRAMQGVWHSPQCKRLRAAVQPLAACT